MCGIVAQFSKICKPPERSKVKSMAHEIKHRGPDDQGFYFSDWFGLGHLRLSIIDLSERGHQPMSDETQRYLIVYNGELYNFKELRSELLECGYSFQSDTDTEVVLKAYMHWKEKCLEKFIGMFAFVIVDQTKESAFVARDQLGIKPLYYYEDSENFLLSSEIKAFRHFTRFEANQDAMYEQFFFRYVSGKRTAFKNVYRVPSGSFIIIDKYKPKRIKTYYNICDSLRKKPKRRVDYAEIENRLFESIKFHTISDVGYTIQLSGGIDSSYITAVLSKEYQQQLNTFSVELENNIYDESIYQKIVSRKCNTHHFSFKMGAYEMMEWLPKATWHMDMPIIHTSCVFLMALCQIAKEKSKVILTGEGADELFGGYGRYNLKWEDKIGFIAQQIGITPDIFPDKWKFSGLRRLLAKEYGLDQLINFPPQYRLMHQKLKKDLVQRQAIINSFPGLLTKIIAADQTSYLESLLERQDKMSMAMSVETRVPFCVHTLFDYINTIDPKLKIKPIPKSILKRLSEKYFNKAFIYRNKNGFLLPINEWLRDPKTLGKYLDLLTDQTFRQRGWYNLKEVEKAISSHLQGAEDRSKELMNLIKFEIWHRLFIENTGV